MDLILIGSFEVRWGGLDIIIVKPLYTWAIRKVHTKSCVAGRSFLFCGIRYHAAFFLRYREVCSNVIIDWIRGIPNDYDYGTCNRY